MNKLLLIVLIAGFASAHTAKGQQRGSGNTSGRSATTPTYRSGATSSLSPSGTCKDSNNLFPELLNGNL